MLPTKLDLTEKVAATLRRLRLEHPVNGEILTAEKLSRVIGNNRAWMSQIESRRLKKVKREDIIAMYKFYFHEEDFIAEKRAELELQISVDCKDKDDLISENIFLKQENEMLKKKLKSIMEIINM